MKQKKQRKIDKIGKKALPKKKKAIPLEILYSEAKRLAENNNLFGAESLYKVIFNSFPDETIAINKLAEISLKQKNYSLAQKRFDTALKANPNNAEALYHVGQTMFGQKEYDKAVDFLNKSLAADPSRVTGWNTLGRAYEHLNDEEKALQAYIKATKINPEYGNAWLNAGKIYHLSGAHEDALRYYGKALKTLKNSQAVYNNLGSLLKTMGRYKDSEDTYRKGIKLYPNSPGMLYNMGNLMRDECRPEEAIKCFEKSLKIDNDVPGVHWNLALAHLLSGNIKEGFKEYLWRWDYDQFPTKKRHFAQPMWDGKPFNGKTLFIYLEQGVGDWIQFARWIPEVVKKKGKTGKLIVECHSGLKKLFSEIPGVDHVQYREETPPPFDTQVPYMTLPYLFQNTLENMPKKTPYLTVPKAAKHKVSESVIKPTDNLKVGIVWAGNPQHGNDKNRSSSLRHWIPLFELDQISWFSLQKGQKEEEPRELKLANKIELLGPHFQDYSETAAVIEHLDLVISVDTSVAHLAGALGKPVWVLVPYSPDWRWLLEREDCPWYPTARIFRQDKSRTWASVMPKLREALSDQRFFKKSTQKSV